MNKEEILNTFLLANIPEIITQEEFDDVKKAIRELQQENKELKDVIEEVREYIKYYLLDNSWFKDSQNEFKKLLQILDKAKEN